MGCEGCEVLEDADSYVRKLKRANAALRARVAELEGALDWLGDEYAELVDEYDRAIGSESTALEELAATIECQVVSMTYQAEADTALDDALEELERMKKEIRHMAQCLQDEETEHDASMAQVLKNHIDDEDVEAIKDLIQSIHEGSKKDVAGEGTAR